MPSIELITSFVLLTSRLGTSVFVSAKPAGDAAPTADTLTVRVRFGTSATPTSNTAIATGTATATTANHIVTIRGRIHIQSATRMVHTVLMDNPPAATGTPNPESFYTIFTSVADTAYNLQMTVDWTTGGLSSAQSECWTIWEDEV